MAELQEQTEAPTLFRRKENLALAMIAGLAVLKLVIHVLTSSKYGYFRDEFYYIAASQHLAFGTWTSRLLLPCSPLSYASRLATRSWRCISSRRWQVQGLSF